ncbi:MAG TPA: hypothetical protein VIE69_07545 [Methylophilaceae bacterium]|jgi:hypothetical protein
MQIKAFIYGFLCCVSLWLAPNACAEPGTEEESHPFELSEKTVAGVLKVIDLSKYDEPGSHYKITLNGKTIRVINDADESDTNHFQGEANPVMQRHFKKPVAGFDEVIVFQQYSYGNACDGGNIWFLGLMRDKTYHISDEIPFCGGKAAVIKQKGNEITVIAPGGKLNIGEGYIPTEKYIYSNRKIEKQ